jgi:ribose transport system substrate-binding protein
MSFRRLVTCMMLAAVLALGVGACGGDDDDDSGGSDTTAADTDTDTGGGSGETVTIAASVPPTDHGWLGAVSKNAEEAAAQFDDVDFELVEAADADSQASQIETLINEKPDALVVLPHDGEALTPVAEKAMEAGISVVNVDRLFSTPEAARATILGDNYGIGVQAATYLAEQLDCEGNVVEIQGLAGISVTEDRTKGFADTIKELCGNGIEIIAQQPGDYNPDTGLEVMEAILQAEDDIDAVYTHDDDMAEGVVAAIQNAQREDEMILTGVGGSCNAFDAISEGGLYKSTYLYNPTMAGSAVNMARLIALGEGFSDLTEPEVPSEVVVPPTEVTEDNVEDLRDYCFN